MRLYVVAKLAQTGLEEVLFDGKLGQVLPHRGACDELKVLDCGIVLFQLGGKDGCFQETTICYPISISSFQTMALFDSIKKEGYAGEDSSSYHDPAVI